MSEREYAVDYSYGGGYADLATSELVFPRHSVLPPPHVFAGNRDPKGHHQDWGYLRSKLWREAYSMEKYLGAHYSGKRLVELADVDGIVKEMRYVGERDVVGIRR